MRFVMTFSSLLFLSCLVGIAHPSSLKDLIQLVTMFIELTAQHMGTITLKNITIPLDINAADIFEGVVRFQEFTISGLENLKVNQNNIDFSLSADGTLFSFCANLSIPDTTRIKFVGYDADIALFNFTVPLYGKGNFLLGIKDIDFALCFTSTISPIYLTDFLLKPGCRGLEFELTGFWNNPELSAILTKVISTFEEIIMWFWTREIDCITCVVSQSLEFIINEFLNLTSVTTNFYKLTEVGKQNCQGHCVLSDYPFLKTLFHTDTSELVNTLRKDNSILNFVLDFEKYLNKYLEGLI